MSRGAVRPATVVTGFREPTTCIVAEVASGVAPGGFVTTAWTATADVSGCPVALPCDPVDPGSGQGVVSGVADATGECGQPGGFQAVCR